MNDAVNHFIQQVLERIQYKKIRQNISLEIQDHIEESKNILMETEIPEEEAYRPVSYTHLCALAEIAVTFSR